MKARRTVFAASLLGCCLIAVVVSSLSFGRPPKRPTYEEYYWKRRALEKDAQSSVDDYLTLAKETAQLGWVREAEELYLDVLKRDAENEVALSALKLAYVPDRGMFCPMPAVDLIKLENFIAGGELKDEVDASASSLEKELERLAKSHFKIFPAFNNDKYWDLYIEERQTLKTLADEAWAIIWDKSIYPDEHHGVVGQPRVDKAVNAARKQRVEYNKILAFVFPFDRIPTHQAKDLESFLLDKARLRRLCDHLGEPERFRTFWERIRGWELEALMRYRGGDFRWVISQCTPRVVKSKEFTVEREFIYRLLYEAVERHNETMATSRSSEAVEFCRKVNDYRVMFDIVPLPSNERINMAALLHSRDMSERGYFAHETDKPGYETPNKRMQQEGYSYGSGENISSGDDAFDGFYNSSGHHRNMLAPDHRVIGAGCCGLLTNTFGSVYEFAKVYGPMGLDRWCDSSIE